jgi:hypothetical protein
MPSWQVDGPQETDGPGKVHVLRVLPSQTAPQVPWPGQGPRLPCGAPLTGEQAPTEPATSHASQVPVQAPLQQTPSTQ